MKEFKPLNITHPELAKEWSDRNFPFTADDEHFESYSKVWWCCKHGHEWYATIRQRAVRNTGCPYCAGKKIIPGFNDFATAHPECVDQWSEKNLPLLPTQFAPYSGQRVIWQCEYGHEWETAISNRSHGNGCPICAKQPVISGENDLSTTHPEIAVEWSEKNYPLMPSQVRAGYKKQVFWVCRKCGCEYECQPFTRTHSKRICPQCAYDNRIRFEPEASSEEVEETPFIPCIPERSSIPIHDEEISDELKEGLMYYGQENYIKHDGNIGMLEEKPIWDKYALSVDEASRYFAISIIKLRALIAKQRDAPYLTYEGGYVFIIRKEFEQYLNQTGELEVGDWKRNH